jgi:hypothetical protein
METQNQKQSARERHLQQMRDYYHNKVSKSQERERKKVLGQKADLRQFFNSDWMNENKNLTIKKVTVLRFELRLPEPQSGVLTTRRYRR